MASGACSRRGRGSAALGDVVGHAREDEAWEAGREERERVEAELKERIVTRCREENGSLPGLAELYVGTIHAFCLDLLKVHLPGGLYDLKQ